jgi:hypothetical protein
MHSSVESVEIRDSSGDETSSVAASQADGGSLLRNRSSFALYSSMESVGIGHALGLGIFIFDPLTIFNAGVVEKHNPGIGPEFSQGNVRRPGLKVKKTPVSATDTVCAGSGSSLTSGSIVKDLVIAFTFAASLVMHKPRCGMESLSVGRRKSSKLATGQ